MAKRRNKGRRSTMVQESRKVPAVSKAIYHNVSGAGRGKVIREFLGLNASDETQLLNLLEKRLERRIG